MASGRLERINALLRSEISQLIARELKDPRICGIVSVTAVETSADLRHARVFISVYGTDDERNSTLAALRSAAGFVRHEVAQRVTFRTMPELEIRLDPSIERGAHLMQLIDQVAAADARQGKPPSRRRSARAVRTDAPRG